MALSGPVLSSSRTVYAVQTLHEIKIKHFIRLKSSIEGREKPGAASKLKSAPGWYLSIFYFPPPPPSQTIFSHHFHHPTNPRAFPVSSLIDFFRVVKDEVNHLFEALSYWIWQCSFISETTDNIYPNTKKVHFINGWSIVSLHSPQTIKSAATTLKLSI